MYKKIFLVYLFLNLYFSFSVFAEKPQQDIGASSSYIEKELERKKKELEKHIEPPYIEVEEKKEEKPTVTTITFFLKDIKITGSSVFDQKDFYPLYKDYLNKQISFNELEEIVNKINQKYQKAGYITTQAYIPQQELKDGIIEIRIDEGKVGDIEIEKGKYFSIESIKKNVHLKKNEILNINSLKKDLLRINKNLDLKIVAVLSAGQEPLTTDITLKVTENFPWHIIANVDNRGSRLTGRIRNNFSIRSLNCTKRLDKLLLSTIKTSRSFGQSLIYKIPIDTYGTEFGIDFSYFTMNIGKEYKHLKIIGQSYQFNPNITKELYLSEIYQLYFIGGLKIKSIDKKIQADTTVNEELRLPYFSFEFNSFDPFGRTSFSPNFTFGTEHFLGASSRNHTSASRYNTGGFFFKYEQSLSRLQKMPKESYLIIDSQFQFSTHTLPTSEQFQLGGVNSVRGYPEGDYLADIGGNLNLEWHFPFYIIPKTWKLKKQSISLRDQIETLLFLDWGWGRLIEIDNNEKREKTLLGVGIGLNFYISKNTCINLIWANHLADEPTKGLGPSTFSFSFQAEF